MEEKGAKTVFVCVRGCIFHWLALILINLFFIYFVYCFVWFAYLFLLDLIYLWYFFNLFFVCVSIVWGIDWDSFLFQYCLWNEKNKMNFMHIQNFIITYRLIWYSYSYINNSHIIFNSFSFLNFIFVLNSSPSYLFQLPHIHTMYNDGVSRTFDGCVFVGWEEKSRSYHRAGIEIKMLSE